MEVNMSNITKLLDMKSNSDFEVLIVDDNDNNLIVLSEILKEESYKVRVAKNGKMALMTIEKKSPDLILLDINMPELDGFEIGEILGNHDIFKHIPIIYVTAFNDIDNKLKAFDLGAVDYITKPYLHEEIKARVALHLKLSDMKRLLNLENITLQNKVNDAVSEITNAYTSTIYAMVELAEARDDDTGKHLQRISTYCKKLAELAYQSNKFGDLTLEFVKDIEIASPLHDIGKIGIEDKILLKPGPLTEGEFERMKDHVTIGAEKLESISATIPNNTYIKLGTAIARFHHEKWDGSGYCEGLKGNNIPIEARIMAISDVYDALRSERIYKASFSHEKALRIMKGLSGSHFDPHLLDIFLDHADWFNAKYMKLSEASDE